MASAPITLLPLLIGGFILLSTFPLSSASSSPPNSSASPSSAEYVYNRTLFALLHFKASIDPTGLSLSSWNTTSSLHFCSWDGITCTFGSDGHFLDVTEISLGNYLLRGTLSPQIENLQGLTGLYLSDNRISGQLPSSLGQLKNLIVLDLSGNLLSGQLPFSLGQLKNLRFLDLSDNLLSGQVPSSLGQLKSVKTLGLRQNQLSGQLPYSLGQMKNLTFLELSSNLLSGQLPSSLAQIESLYVMVLSKNNFSGQLPSFLGQMKNLKTLILSGNLLSGQLPSSLGQMKSLTDLDLSVNLLSGKLPYSLDQMDSLSDLNLSQNLLSGPFPSFLGQQSIYYLDLSYNQLSGPLPSSLADSPFYHLEFLNVSYNRLQGVIPSSLYFKFSSESFLGNPGLCSPSLCSGNDHPRKKISLRVVVCSVMGLALISLLVSFCACRYCFRKQNPGLDVVASQYKAWTAEEMRVATNNFDAANVIGSGAASTCYLGTVTSPEGMMRLVALKRLTAVDINSDGEDDEAEARKSFVNEFKTLGKLRHRNLVKVLGYCVEGAEVALVMEYMEGRDLDRRLHTIEARKLSWEERVSVALDVAEGLVYLHHEYDRPIIHCDVKPKNILLRADMVAKISDFGIARLVEGKERADVSMSKFRGSFGYIAPEYGMGLKISTKIDVYSYGMLLLELVTGVRPTSLMLENEAMSLRTWVATLRASGRIRDVLCEYDHTTLQEANELLRLGVRCTHDVAKKRPTMYIVRDFILQLKKGKGVE